MLIKCTNLSKEEIESIGKEIATAFLAEDGMFVSLPLDVASRMYAVIVDTCYRAGHLYTTSSEHEGYIVYWTKRGRPGFIPQLRMGLKLSRCMSIKQAAYILPKGWTPTEKRYKKSKDFVEVFLIAVRKEYQGQGHFRAMLEEVFDIARERGTICVLDTDSQTKADKYAHVGMHIVDSKRINDKATMFAMEI